MKQITFLIILILGGLEASANNLKISNVSTIVTSTYTQVEFDISWDNSWRSQTGLLTYDAAWVFIKYKVGNQWRHLNLTGINNEISDGIIENVNDRKGVFVRRLSSFGSGNVSLKNVRLGVQVISGSFDIKVFGIEMVFAATSSPTYLGDGNGTIESTYSFHTGTGNTMVQLPINSLTRNVKVDVNIYDDNQIELSGIGIAISGGSVPSGGIDTDNNGTIDNPNFPSSHNLYCMKYELSQAGYRDFLNTLTYTQQMACVYVAPNSPSGTNVMGGTARSFIKIKTPGVASTVPATFGLDANGNNIFDEAADGESIACGGLSWSNVCSYLDWAALRPMTEIEFEMISHSGMMPTIGNYAWGTPDIHENSYTLLNEGENSETITNYSTSTGNAIYNLTYPNVVRNGIFATSLSGRTQAGATYSGIMEMSGNLAEWIVTIGNASGRSYTGKNGDGNLNFAGNADVDYWPGVNGNNSTSTPNSVYNGSIGVTGTAGSGQRGGSFADNSEKLRVANRQDAANGNASRLNAGCRGTRGL
ncbi:MAG: hypothetical protein DYG99_10260 [Bacteroidetes bacterium CHB5]|nr:hypothetical protein [Bacteroidetes bacterium CHB5]